MDKTRNRHPSLGPILLYIIHRITDRTWSCGWRLRTSSGRVSHIYFVLVVRGSSAGRESAICMLVAWQTAVKTRGHLRPTPQKTFARFTHPLSKNISPSSLGKTRHTVTASNIKRARHWPVRRPFILMPVSDAICCVCVWCDSFCS